MNQNNENKDYQFSFEDLDPYYTQALKKQKGGGTKKFLKALTSFIVAVVFTVSVSAGSIFVYDRYFLEKAAIGQSSPTSNGGSGTVYLPVSTSDALTTPQIYDNSINSVVAISTVKQQNGYITGSGTGTGVIMSKDGYIITNDHVVSDSNKITVYTNDGAEYEATLVGSDPKVDIAVIKIEATDLQAATFGKPDDLTTGEPAVVIGNPLGLNFAGTTTTGVISSTSREIEMNGYIMKLIQTNAAINPGNSGGPLINSRGEVIGIVNSKIASAEVEGIGFAIPIDTALSVANDFIEYGYVRNRPMLGITVEEIDRYTAKYNGIEAGLRIATVAVDSAADKAGLLPGDMVVAVNGVDVTTLAELDYEKGKYKIGETISLTVSREGKETTVDLTLLEATSSN